MLLTILFELFWDFATLYVSSSLPVPTNHSNLSFQDRNGFSRKFWAFPRLSKMMPLLFTNP
jgi:hypothetical protein